MNDDDIDHHHGDGSGDGDRSGDARPDDVESGRDEHDGQQRLYEALPGLARIAAGAGWRTLHWMTAETLTTGEAVVAAVADGQSPLPAVRAATHEAWSSLAHTLGVADDEPAANGPPRRDEGRASTAELRARGADLLHRSADVRDTDDTHPAFEHILDELTPDEARVLRFLVVEGPQPSVDVRTNRPLGIGSELVADGLSMIGMQAGVRRLDRTKSYLDNLFRLGLIWFSREPVEPARYQVVEVQPEVVAAMKRAGRAPKTIRRSIHLTTFGEEFCETCLPIEPGPPAPQH